jgi:hypothetical protein
LELGIRGDPEIKFFRRVAGFAAGGQILFPETGFGGQGQFPDKFSQPELVPGFFDDRQGLGAALVEPDTRFFRQAMLQGHGLEKFRRG